MVQHSAFHVPAARPLIERELMFCLSIQRLRSLSTNAFRPLPMNVIVGAKFTRDCTVSLEMMHSALETLTSLQPYLRHTLKRKWFWDQQCGFCSLALTPTHTKVPLIVSTLDNEETIDKCFEDSLNHQWQLGKPLAHLNVTFRCKRPYAFYFCASHAILDGRSVELLARGFIEILCTGSTSLTYPTLRALYHIISEPENAAITSNQEHPVLTNPPSLEKSQAAFERHCGMLNRKGRVINPLKQTGYGVHVLTFSLEETAMIRSAAKHFGVTVNSFLTVVLAQEASMLPAFHHGHINACHALVPIDARCALPMKYQRACGNFFALCKCDFATTQTFSDACQRVDSQVKYHRQASNVLRKRPWSKFDGLRQRFGSLRRILAVNHPGFLDCQPVVSNLGLTNWCSSEHLGIQEAFFLAGVPNLPFFCCIITVRNALTLSVSFTRPAIHMEDVRQLCQQVKSSIASRTEVHQEPSV